MASEKSGGKECETVHRDKISGRVLVAESNREAIRPWRLSRASVYLYSYALDEQVSRNLERVYEQGEHTYVDQGGLLLGTRPATCWVEDKRRQR